MGLFPGPASMTLGCDGTLQFLKYYTSLAAVQNSPLPWHEGGVQSLLASGRDLVKAGVNPSPPCCTGCLLDASPERGGMEKHTQHPPQSTWSTLMILGTHKHRSLVDANLYLFFLTNLVLFPKVQSDTSPCVVQT